MSGVEGHLDRAYERSIKILELADEIDDKYFSIVGNLRAGQIAIYMGEGKASIKHREAGLQAAEELRDRYLLAMSLRAMSRSSYKKGELIRARELAERSRCMVSGHYQGYRVFHRLCWTIFFEYQSGQIQEGEALCRKLFEIYEQSPTANRRLLLLTFLPRFAHLRGTAEHADGAIGLLKTHLCI